MDLDVTGAPIRDAAGQIVGAVCAVRDVTARRQTERESAERAAQLRAIFDVITDGILVFDVNGRLLDANAAALAANPWLDNPHARLMPVASPATPWPIHDTEGRPLPVERWPISRVLRGEALGGPEAVDLLLTSPDDGTVRSLNVGGAPIRDEQGRLIGGVMVSRDVTDRRARERHTREVLEALLEVARTLVMPPGSEEAGADQPSARLEAIGRRLADLIWRVLGCRRLSMVAIDPRTGIQTPLAAMGLTPEEERTWREATAGVSLFEVQDPLTQAIVERIRGGEVFVLDMTQPPFNANPYGVRHLLIAPMRVGDDLVGLYSLDYGAESHAYTADDLALAAAVARLAALTIERERLIREREEARSGALALREANRRMDEFLGLASHELRTPLTGLRGSLQVMQRRLERAAAEALETGVPVLSGRLAPFLERAWRQSGVLAGLVDDLLEVSRLQAGQLRLQLVPLDLVALVRQTVQERILLDPERDIRLEVPAGPLTVTVDAARLAQVVDHYLDNALKFSSATEPVAVGIDVDDATARVWVHDRGPGIPAVEQGGIWERFYRPAGTEHRSGSSEGLGLGLYFCRTIVERHGGQVGVESSPGAGATFWLTLPLGTSPGAGMGEPAS
jgi:signal transduction histidine kinase/PAS domain-containing protein